LKKKTDVTTKKRVYKKPLNEKHIIGFLFGIAFSISLFLGGLLFILALLKIPDIRNVAEYQPLQATEIVDHCGGLITRIYLENRTVVPLRELPSFLPQAFVAAEDSRFYSHPGLDFWSVFRAALNNVKSGHRGQGGSTITQQVAKSLLLSPEKTYLRKFKEAILAWRIDTLLPKDDILHIYLNQIYLGDGAYGVEAAAKTYFAKSARDLSIGESALLAGLPQAPSRYAPNRHMVAARKRQRYVLNRMSANGYISSAEARAAYESPVVLTGDRKKQEEENGYFIQLVKKQAEEILKVSLNRAGVKIYTTLDKKQQQQTVTALRRGLANSFPGNVPVQGAAIVMDGKNGMVRALAGGCDFSKSVFDRATQARRSAGSLFKPILYSTAFASGFTPENSILDSPISITGKNGQKWEPKNFTGRHYGKTTLAEALIKSRNIVAIRLLQKLGIQRVQTMARAFGLRPPITADLSLALGATGVSLLEITAAYSPFMNGGNYSAPVVITGIAKNDGQRIYNTKTLSRRVLSPVVAREMRGLLARVIDEGTGKRAAGVAPPYGGKTGTTNSNRDAWFVGFSGNRLGGVWIGNDDNSSLGSGKTGGVVAAPVWREMMGKGNRNSDVL